MKLNQTRQKQACIRNKIYYNVKFKKTKTRFGRLLQTPAWKRNGPNLEVDKSGTNERGSK